MVRIAALTTLLVALMTSSVTAAPALDERAALEEMLGRVQLMPGRGHRALTVFPLVLPAGEKETAAKSVKSLREAVEDREIVLAEPLKPARRYNVLVTSRSEQAVLLPAGTILTGGRLDRMIPRDTLVAPGQQLQIGTLPAEYRRDSRDGKGAPTDFRVSRHLAPLVLRQGGVFSARLDLVPSFIARFLDYRPVGNRRHTMDAISASPVLAGMLKGDLAALANVPRIYEGRVVGWVTMIGDRIHGLELFATNALAADHYPAILRAHMFSAAAMTLRAEELGIRRPGSMGLLEPELHRAEVEAFLSRVRESTWSSRSDGSLRLRKGRTRGLALAGEDRIVHVSAVADLAFLQRLHDAGLPTPPHHDEGHSFGRMSRASAVEGRRNTAYEERLLERMRDRR